MRTAYLSMIRAFPGGWDAMAAALGLSRDALENRIYERKGQSILVETAMQMQSFSNTTAFAEQIAAASGGVFMRLPDAYGAGQEELLAKFNALYAELGELSAKFHAYVQDGEITTTERADLSKEAQDIHRVVQELLALSFAVYCRPGQDAA